MCNIAAKGSADKKRKCPKEIQHPNCRRKYVINIMVKIQFRMNKHSKIFDGFGKCNRDSYNWYSKPSNFVSLEKEITTVLLTLNFVQLEIHDLQTEFTSV